MNDNRELSPYSVFEQFKIVKWFKGIPITEDDNIIYHLGDFYLASYLQRGRITIENENIPADDLFDLFNSDPNIGKIKGLSIGAIFPIKRRSPNKQFDFMDEEPFFFVDDYSDFDFYDIQDKILNEFCNKLIKIKYKLKDLKYLIIGNYFIDDRDHISLEFNQIKEILDNFRSLNFLLLRGSITIPERGIYHPKLSTLIIEGLGLTDTQIKDLLHTDFPNLTRLDIHIGTKHYRLERKRWNENEDRSPERMNPEIFLPLFAGNYFPKLKHLGLLDCDFADEIAIEISSSELLKRLEVLDLSYCFLTDEGAEILLNSPEIKNLKMLKLRGHYCSKELIKYMEKIVKKMNIELKLDAGFNARGERFEVIRE